MATRGDDETTQENIILATTALKPMAHCLEKWRAMTGELITIRIETNVCILQYSLITVQLSMHHLPQLEF